MKTYLDHVIEQELKDCTPDELMATLDLAIYINKLKTYPAINRRRKQRHMVNDDRRRHPMTPTPRLMFAVVLGMVAVSVTSWVYVLHGFTLALYLIPAYAVYVVAILGLRSSRIKRSRS